MANLAKIQNAMKIQKDGETIGRMDISGEVGWDWYGDAWDAGYFKAQLAELGDVGLIEVYINSPGGSVIDGIAIYNQLVQHPATVHVYIEGVAASIASVIAMAGDKIFMPSNTLLFVHQPWMYTAGNADELRKDADMLDTMRDAIVNSYLRHLKGSSDQVEALMQAETWLSAEDAAGTFNNVVVLAQKKAVEASLDMHNLGNKLPKAAKAFLFEEKEEKEGLRDKIIKLLDRKGFKEAAKTVREDLLDLNPTPTKQEEKDMTQEEKDALKTEIVAEVQAGVAPVVTEALQASLIAAGIIPDPENPATPEDAVAFEGDPSKPEDIQAHLKKLADIEAAKIMDSGDPVKIQKYLDSLKETNAAGAQPAGNVTTSAQPSDGDDAQKEQDAKDTSAFLLDAMPSR